MGCASSTPMVATAGSEILKTASHVAEDATKKVEDTAHEVADAVGKTLDTAKEAVGTKVTGIANDITSAFKNKTDQLEDAKNQTIDKLLPHDGDTETHKRLNHLQMQNEAMSTIKEHNSGAAILQLDDDSLKTSTPEPEIELAMANHGDDDSPPTPKPTLSELEQLSAELGEGIIDMQTPHNEHGHNKDSAAVPSAITAIVAAETAAEATQVDQIRPGTTEWEKYADTLASSRKYLANEGVRRAGRFVPQTQPYYQANNFKQKPLGQRLRRQESWLGESQQISANSHISPLASHNSSPNNFTRKTLPHNLTNPANVRYFQHEFASLVNYDKPAQSKLPRKAGAATIGRKFDFNAQRSRMHLPTAATTTIGVPTSRMTAARSLSRIHSPIQRDSQTNWTSLRSSTTHIGKLPSNNNDNNVPLHNGIRSYRSHTNSPLHTRSIVTRSTVVTPIKQLSMDSNASSASSSSSDCVVIKSALTSSATSSPVKLQMMSISDMNIASLGERTPSLILDTVSGTTTTHKRLQAADSKQSLLAISANTSPRRSSFSSRHSNGDLSEKENIKFIADLSSVTERRSSLVTSPYKIRERCAVCYNKYVVK